MRKVIFTFLLIFTISFHLSGQTAARRAIDLVVLVDTSAGMSDYYMDTSVYLTGQFLREYLCIGDTFHLISFSKEPRLEIVRRIEAVGDLETIIARMLLLYPIARETDPVKALDYAENYVSTLPQTRGNRIVLVSGNSASDTRNAVDVLSARLGRGDACFVQVPVARAASVSERQQTAAAKTETSPAIPASETPPAFTETFYNAPEELVSEPLIEEEPVLNMAAEVQPIDNLLTEIPPSVIPSSNTITSINTISMLINKVESLMPYPIIAVIILLILILGLIVFQAAGKLRSSPNLVMAHAAGQTVYTAQASETASLHKLLNSIRIPGL